MPTGNIRSEFKKMIEGEGAVKSVILTGLAELIGTAILVFLGCMGCIGGFGSIPPHLQITLNFGLSVMIVIQCIGHISHAHINPAITAGAIVLGLKTIPQGLVYFFAQCIGAVLGYGLLKIVTPQKHLTSGLAEGNFCVTSVNPNLLSVQGFLVEALATGILMLVACGVWDPRNAKNTDSVAIKFGLTVAALATAAGPYTGCSMNPARSLAPALWNNSWSGHWVYWLGPICGSTLAAFMYRTIFSVKEVEEEEHIPETLALNSVETQKSEQM